MNLNSGDGGGLFLDFSNLIINYQQKRSLYLTVILEGTIIQVRSVTILTKKCSLFATLIFSVFKNCDYVNAIADQRGKSP